MKISREIKTALLVIGGISLFVYGFSFLKGNSLFKNSKTIYAVYQEIEGLIPGAKVRINGLSVGKISKIDFTKMSPDDIKSTIKEFSRTLDEETRVLFDQIVDNVPDDALLAYLRKTEPV